MAGELKFPIKFDLDTSVKEAEGKIPDAIKKLQDKVDKNPLVVKMKFDTKSLDNLDAVKARLAAIKLEPITPETRNSIRELTQHLQSLAKALENIKKIDAKTLKSYSSADAARAQKMADAHAVAEQKVAAAKAKAELAEEKLRMARERQTGTTQKLNNEYKNQHSYLNILIKRMATYASVGYIGQFLSQVREVTAQFELQRVSLGAIIQDQAKADEIFSSIKSFALKTPVSILELTKYTKQLAAYRIETDKLFDTTKRLADVSVGLGADMSRLILAYGETKATNVMNAKELRQFAMMGIPMLELVSEKLSEIKGKTISTTETFEMIKKRMVGFDVVEQVFEDMTSAGGTFYNMQEKQGNTLYGLWMKLGDAASIMYNEIGTTDYINQGMKDTIQLLTTMMKNWRAIAREIKYLAVAFTVWKTGAALIKMMTVQTNIARAATIKLEAAERTLAAARRSGNGVMTIYANIQKNLAQWTINAARSTNILTVAINKLKIAAVSWGPMLAVTAIATLINWMQTAYEKAHALSNALKEIQENGAGEAAKSVSNFVSLANVATESADGSKRQRDAMDELLRTYQDIIPVEDLQLENLRKLKDEGYIPLTNAIKEYIEQRTLQQQVDKITEDYGAELLKLEREIGKVYLNYGRDTLELTDAQKARLLAGIKEYAQDASLTFSEVFGKAMEDYVGIQGASIPQQSATAKYIRKLQEEQAAIEGVTASAKKQYGEFAEYQEQLLALDKKMENLTLKDVSPDSFLGQQITNNARIKEWIKIIKEDVPGIGDDWYNLIEQVSEDTPNLISSMNLQPIIDKLGNDKPRLKKLLQEIQKQYNEIVPSDVVVRSYRAKFDEIVKAMSVNFDDVRYLLIENSEDLKDYRKRVADEVEKIQTTLLSLTAAKAIAQSLGGVSDTANIDAQIESANKQLEFAKKLLESMPSFDSKKSSGSKKTATDNRLQELQEEVSLLEKMYTKYKEYAEYIGSHDAQAKVNEQFKDTIKLFKKYGIELPTTAKEYEAALKKMQQRAKKLPKSKKEVQELGFKIDDIDFEEFKTQLEKGLKKLSYEISRGKTMRDFYEKVFSVTNDKKLSEAIFMNVYNSDILGKKYQENMVKQLEDLFRDKQTRQKINLSYAIDYDTNKINYRILRDLYDSYSGSIIEKNRDTIDKLISDGEKLSEERANQWLKDLEKAKDFADQRIELSRYTANKIAEIEASDLDDTAKKQLIEGYSKREAKEAAKLEYEAFKSTPLYVQMFDDLDNASAAMLRNMKKRLKDLKAQWGESLDPQNLKEMQKRMTEIEEKLAGKSPFKSLKGIWKEWRDLVKQGRSQKSDNLAVDTAEYQRQKAYEKMLDDEGKLQAMRADANADPQDVKNAEAAAEASKEAYKQTEKAADKAADNAEQWKKLQDRLDDVNEAIDKYQEKINDAIADVRTMMELFGGSDIDLQFFDDLVSGLNDVVDGTQAATTAFMQFATGNIFDGVISSVSSITKVISGISSLVYAGKVRAANREIEKQQKIIDNLTYSYGRLEKAAEKLFGADWLSNYNQQLASLEAQQAAYEKQLAAERSKGKKADDDKIKEYEEAIRDIKDQIEDLGGTVSEQLFGSSLTSFVSDVAQAALQARQEFSSMVNTISDKWTELLQTMAVNSVLSKVIEQALKPVYDMVDNMNESDFYDMDFWRELTKKAEESSTAAANGAETMLNFLQAAGVNISSTSSELSGIARDISTASEESINGLAAGINTQNFYIAQIHYDVAEMLALVAMSKGATSSDSLTTQALTSMQTNLSYLPSIAQNTADMVSRCERAATACEKMSDLLSRVITVSQNQKNNKFSLKIS